MLTEREYCLLYWLGVTSECSETSTQEETFQDGKYICHCLERAGGWPWRDECTLFIWGTSNSSSGGFGIVKNHICVFETLSVTQIVAGGEKKYQEVFWRQGESSLNVINSSVLWVLSRLAFAGVPACEAMLNSAYIYCSWMNFSH